MRFQGNLLFHEDTEKPWEREMNLCEHNVKKKHNIVLLINSFNSTLMN